MLGSSPLDAIFRNDPVVPAPSTPVISPESRHAILDLQHKVERQHLFIQTLLRLLIEKGIVQESEFREWLSFVDGFDGLLDGKLKPDAAPKSCPSCGRKSPATYPRCQYCSTDFPLDVLETDRRSG